MSNEKPKTPEAFIRKYVCRGKGIMLGATYAEGIAFEACPLCIEPCRAAGKAGGDWCKFCSDALTLLTS